MSMTEISTSAEGLGLSVCIPSCVVAGTRGEGESLLGAGGAGKKSFMADEDCGGCEGGDFASVELIPGSSPYFQPMYPSAMPSIRGLQL